ncbi:MAG: FtsW/RodA/SpoVE family cell cycle protein [Nocardioides sp.]|nr:FtsW/RodA/SpoVE family cell cycle protein [Nocardioides sp.]
MLSIERGSFRSRRYGQTPGLPARLPEVTAFDPWAVAAVATLIGLGLVNLASIGARSLLWHQLVVVGAGVVLFLVLRRWRTDGLRWLGWSCYTLSIALLLAVDAAATSVNGARRWLAFGSFTMQPSELAKLGLLLVLAQVLGSDRSWQRRLLLALVVAGLPIALVLTEPDLSTAAVLCALTGVMLILGRIPLRALLVLLAGALAAAPLGVHLMRPYQQERLNAFLSGSTHGSGWAILQMHIALAWGGVTGGGEQHLHNLVSLYLPDRETDLAFTSLVEQRGIIAGALAVLAAAVLVWRMVAASRRARSRAAALAAGGFAALVSVEVGVSVAGNLGLVPTAGVPFPLLSYGGTAATVHIAALGLILGLRADGEARRLWSTGATGAALRPRLMRTTAAVVTGCLLAMVGFAWQLQTDNGRQLRAAALSQAMRCTTVPAARGEITDRHGVPLAVDVRRDRVEAVPALVQRSQMRRLASLTARPLPELRRLLRHHRTSLNTTVATVPPSVGRRVRAAHLRGVFVVPTTGRHYPYGALLGPILGWTGVATPVEAHRWPDLPPGAVVGRAGLEQTYDPVLRGTDGRQCVYVTPAGTPIRLGPYTPPRRGPNVRLTLDLGLQRHLTHDLTTVLQGVPGQPRGDLGGAVILDPRNGQVLAMASLPSYDDNVFGPPVHQTALTHVSQRPNNPMLEHVTQATAPPGSTFKLVVAAADARTGTVPPTQILPGGGSWTLGNHTFHNWMPLPSQDLPEAIAWSNDVYFYQLAWALGPQQIVQTARTLGVGRPTGIDLPGESSGYLGSPSQVARSGGTWYPGSTVILGIGQGYLTVTPLQDALWTAGVATGQVPTPHFGLSYGHTLGPITRIHWPHPRTLPYAGSLAPVRAGMSLAATSGTASIMRALPVTAGAKTGSAQDPSAPNGATDSWFTATAPLNQPAVVATSYVRGGGEGVTTSGKVVLPAMQYFFAHEKQILSTASKTASKTGH